MDQRRVMIIGIPEVEHVGAHLFRAASNDGVPVTLVDSRESYRAPRLLRRVLWAVDRYPAKRISFSDHVRREASWFRPSHAVFTGISPVTSELVRRLSAQGVETVLYLTDDPWNPAHRSRWFFQVLREFSHVFSTRRSNLAQLAATCNGAVSFLPFAYDPALHYPVEPSNEFECDVSFVGNPDADRLDVIRRLPASLKVGLFGRNWDRFVDSSVRFFGYATPDSYRKVASSSKVSLLLVRKANRDGHVMRTFELAAQAACILAEHTDEHVEILGPESECVHYFRDPNTLQDELRRLVVDREERERLRHSVLGRIQSRPHTYRDRLRAMLGG